MEIWKVWCYSNCGTYFAGYLQSVSVIANNREDAIAQTQRWFKEEGRNFIRDDPKTWIMELLTNNIAEGVFDYHHDSDY